MTTTLEIAVQATISEAVRLLLMIKELQVGAVDVAGQTVMDLGYETLAELREESQGKGMNGQKVRAAGEIVRLLEGYMVG